MRALFLSVKNVWTTSSPGANFPPGKPFRSFCLPCDWLCRIVPATIPFYCEILSLGQQLAFRRNVNREFTPSPFRYNLNLWINRCIKRILGCTVVRQIIYWISITLERRHANNAKHWCSLLCWHASRWLSGRTHFWRQSNACLLVLIISSK